MPPATPAAKTPAFAAWRVVVWLLLLLAAFGCATLVGYFLRLRAVRGTERKFHWLALTMISFVVLGFIAYNRSYFQVQGRYLYPGIFGFASVAGFGLYGLASGNEPVLRKLASVWIAALLLLDIYVAVWLLPIAFAAMEACR